MIQLAIYAAIAAFLVAAGVTVVETYNHNITKAAGAEQRATNAEQRANASARATQNLQELVDYGDQLTKDQKQELADQDERLRTMDGKIRAGAAKDPKGYACESTAVPSAVRELRRATFDAPAPAGVLHPAGPAATDTGATAPGRDVRPGEGGSGSGPQAAPLVQQRQGDSLAAPRQAEPTTLRARLQALMKGKP